jgi:hypothetical protein
MDNVRTEPPIVFACDSYLTLSYKGLHLANHLQLLKMRNKKIRKTKDVMELNLL